MKSTSFHKISADKTNIFYKIFARLLHSTLNRINNLNANNNVDRKIDIKYFSDNNLDINYKKLNKFTSPSRKLSNIFWITRDWNKIKKELKRINICDIGCGSGNYYLTLQHYSQNSINSYKGLDININNNWKLIQDKHKNISFEKYNGIDILNKFPTNTNLIISQSAIEHFSEDYTIFKQIKEFIQKAKQPIYQIHLFPSKACLKLYPFHGVRQYTPRNISKITNLFSDFSEVTLFELGGENSNNIHRKYFNSRFLKRNITKNENYEEKTYNAIKADFNKTGTKNPNFYALIIKSNFADEN